MVSREKAVFLLLQARIKQGPAILDRPLPSVSGDSSTEILKTLVGVVLGLAILLGGWIVFSAEGFYSPMLFLIGTIMVPLGVLLLGTSLTGGFGESPTSLLIHIRDQEREREKTGFQ